MKLRNLSIWLKGVILEGISKLIPKETAVALSIRQPWAELILQGKKTIETRKWYTKFRGEFYIHAPKTIDLEACKKFKIDPNSLVTGALVGKAACENVVKYLTDEHFMSDQEKHQSDIYALKKSKFGFLLCGIQRITPIPAKGKLNFFQINIDSIISPKQEQTTS